MMPLVRQLFDGDHNFAVRFTRELDLEQDHIACILGVEGDSPRVRDLLAAAEAGRDRGVARRSDDDRTGVAVSLGEFASEEGAEEEEEEEEEAGDNGGEAREGGKDAGGAAPEKSGDKKETEDRQKKLFDF
jgi:hypothetical protein